MADPQKADEQLSFINVINEPGEDPFGQAPGHPANNHKNDPISFLPLYLIVRTEAYGVIPVEVSSNLEGGSVWLQSVISAQKRAV